VTLSTQKQ